MENKRGQSDLAELRREIDAIDDRLAGLLVERAGVVARIREKKRDHAPCSAMRPGREAEIVRRVAARVGAAMPARAVLRIWREIIAAATRAQSPFRVHILDDAGRPAYEAHGRLHFGTLAPLVPHREPADLLRALGESPRDVAILPIERGEPRNPPWWTLLASPLAVIAALPMIAPGRAVSMAVLGQARPEMSGHDATLVVLTHGRDVSAGALTDALAKAGVSLDVAAWTLTPEGATRSLGVLGGFHAGDGEAVEALRAHGLVSRAEVIGAYALPLEAGEMER